MTREEQQQIEIARVPQAPETVKDLPDLRRRHATASFYSCEWRPTSSGPHGFSTKRKICSSILVFVLSYGSDSIAEVNLRSRDRGCQCFVCPHQMLCARASRRS